jgi:hypothetical protein
MGAPVQYTYYFLNTAYAGTNHGGTSLTAPGNTNTTWGWNVGTLTASSACQMDFGVEVLRTTLTQWKSNITASAPDNIIGNCWVIGPLHGRFSDELVKITMSVKATTNATGQDGRFVYRFWKSDNAQSTVSALITGSYISSSIVTNATTTPVALTSSFRLNQFDLHNEYLFIHTQWQITGPAPNNAADINFVLGSAAANITLPTYISHPTTNVNLIQEEYPHGP